jgi:ATP-dependent RNA helicase RhlE
MEFSNLGLSPQILKAIEGEGYKTPSEIQAKAIPAVLEGRDVMAAAQTGTGKTAGFTLPILQRLAKGPIANSNHVRVLIITPTRELAAQVKDSVSTYSKHMHLRSAVVFGGVKINPQMMRLRKGVDILVATPGRLLDLYNQNAVKFDQLEILVLDEADRMLDMGFIHDIRKIINLLPKQRQTLMFSATFSDSIRNLAKGLVQNPVEITVSPKQTTAASVQHSVVPVDKKQKSALLAELIKTENWYQVLVFTKTKHGANKLCKFLIGQNIPATAIHGNKSQSARTTALAEFKANKVQVLVATDIAARGIDIDQLPQVVNFELPHVSEDYVHRIGRTGRAGSSGQAVSLVCADEYPLLAGIEKLIQKVIPRKLVDGFEPVHDVPVSNLDTRPIKPKKPKKPRVDHRDGQRSGEMKQGHKPSKHKPRAKRQPIAKSGATGNTASPNPRSKRKAPPKANPTKSASKSTGNFWSKKK